MGTKSIPSLTPICGASIAITRMVPTLGKLKAERDALILAKKEKKDRYDSAKAVQKDLYTARTNVERILDEPKVIERSKEAAR